MNWKPWIRKAIGFVLVVWLAFSQIGCGKGDKIRKAVDASPRIAGQVETLLDNIIAASDAGKLPIGPATKMVRIIKDKVNPLQTAYANAVAAFPKTVPPTKPTPAQYAFAREKWKALSAAITEIGVVFKLLTPAQAAVIQFAIDTLFDTIDIIANGFAVANEFYGIKEELWTATA